MRYLTQIFLAVVAGVGLALLGGQAEAQNVAINDPENTIIITVGYDYPSADAGAAPGRTADVTIELLPDVAPNHVARIKELAREGYYDGVPFHRVIDGFMAQTGDGQNGDGTGGSSKEDLRAEFSDVPYERGTVGMARTQYEHSANSQFFITFENADFLNNQYTVFGKVIDGMDNVDAIKRGVGQSGSVPSPADRMVSVKVVADQ